MAISSTRLEAACNGFPEDERVPVLELPFAPMELSVGCYE